MDDKDIINDDDDYTAYKISDDEIDGDPNRDYYAEDRLSEWGKDSKWDSIIIFLKNNGLIIIGICLAVGIFFMLYQRLFKISAATNNNEIIALEARINVVEERIKQNTEPENDLDGLQTKNQQVEQLIKRVDRLESNIARQLLDFSTRLAAIDKNKVARKKDLTPSPPTKKVGTKSTVRFHTIKANDTLYSIGKRYGLSINELRRLNNLSTKTIIHPGQKLRISR